MFIELKGDIYNLYKHSKISKYLVENGAPSNQIQLWNGLTTQTYLEYGEDVAALNADWELIMTTSSAATLVVPE